MTVAGSVDEAQPVSTIARGEGDAAIGADVYGAVCRAVKIDRDRERIRPVTYVQIAGGERGSDQIGMAGGAGRIGRDRL